MTNKSSDCQAELLTSSPEQMAADTALAAIAKAMSHPARVRILRTLNQLHRKGGCLGSDLVSELGLAQSTVSEHMRILKTADLIVAEPDPPRVCYKINPSRLAEFQQMLSGMFT